MARDKRLNRQNKLKADRCFTVVKAWCGYPKPKFGVFWPWLGWGGDCLGFFDTQKEAVDYCEKLVEHEYFMRSDLQKLDQKELKAYVASH